MIKFVIEYEDSVEVIVNTRADAEEYILSLAEDGAYDEYTGDLLYYNVPHNEFMENYREHMDAVNAYRRRWSVAYGQRTFQTLYGFMLNYHGEHYFIREVACLDD